MPKKFQIEVKDDDPAQTGSAWREIARKREAEIIRLRTRVAELEVERAEIIRFMTTRNETHLNFYERVKALLIP